jgi:2-dehydropantoate 2-reductase
VWTKVALNLATNPLSVVTGAMLGDMCSDERLLPIISTILDETGRVAMRYDARPALTRSAMLARARGGVPHLDAGRPSARAPAGTVLDRGCGVRTGRKSGA